ncbi:MAG: hypothetical protein IJY25_00180 [Bacilli bacterium]|nr:hypothetical protein [Clostridia bacterium]MBQ9071561.1 hypothetical protein [Bacilli bacterium]
MAHAKRKPPIKMKADIRGYNFLVEILSIHAERDNEKLSNKASKLKDKILRYSVPFETEDKDTLIDIRFYNNEAEDLIEILFNSIDEFEVNANYFEVLLKVRESIQKENREE